LSAQSLLDPLFTTSAMREVFSDRQRLQSMLGFEAALARAIARAGIAPEGAADVIQQACRAELYSLDSLATEALLAGNLAIPLVKALSTRVAKTDPVAAGFVHWGATSQDVIDTGLVLQLRKSLEIFDADLKQFADELASSTRKHASLTMPGRTWLQQAPPVTLGLKIVGWLDAIDRHRVRLREVIGRVLVVQFGGAVGTLAALGDRGPKVARALADELRLMLPPLPWHSHRDRLAEVATTLGLLTGTLGKIARDISLLMQTEVGEALEPGAPGRGGSSTMPHKRNPIGSASVQAAAIRVPALVSVMLTSMVQEQERGLGGWQAEWETLPEICLLAEGALARTSEIVAGLEVDAERMTANLKLKRGLILAESVVFALAEHMGRQEALAIVEEGCQRAIDERADLAAILAEDSRVTKNLSCEEISSRLDPNKYLGSATEWMEAVLLAHKESSK
jgi:3-carboxy-cis,cis-muconate cycloisomerase